VSLRKFCSPAAPAVLPDGRPNPLHCSSSPNCGHHWFYDFRVNRRRYRNTTETENKQQAKKFEAAERTRVLEGRHQIRQQPDITFKAFAATYLKDYAEPHKRSVERDRYIVDVLNRSFGSLILHEITAHRIEQFKRERLAGKWQGHKHTSTPKTIQPATVNRELDTLSHIFTKAVEWGKLREHPMLGKVKALKIANRRTRILTEAEQLALLAACPKTLARMVRLALITGARIGELLALTWADVSDNELVFLETKNGTTRRLPMSPAMAAVFKQCPKGSTWVFTNARTRKAYTANGVRHVFNRAVVRAGILTGDVTVHTLRHTALSRMIASGIDDHTVMAISGHSSQRMLARYTHPTNARKIEALESITASLGRMWAESENTDTTGDAAGSQNRSDVSGKSGGRQEARTPDLCVANAALSQLS